MGSSFKLKGGRGKIDPYAALQRQGLISPIYNEPEKLGDIKGEEVISGMAGYTSMSFANPSGEGLKVYKPEDRTIGGTTKYLYTGKSGEQTEITQDQYKDKLSKGGYKKQEEKQAIGGGGS